MVFEHTNDGITIADANGVIVAVNKAFSRITGYRPEEVIGKNPRLLQSGRQDGEFYRQMWEALIRRGSWQGEIWDRKKSGELFPAWQNITAIKDADGRIGGYIAVFSDISKIKATEERLFQLAYHDPLTGLPNRLLFADRLAQTLVHARRSQTRAAMLMLDLDRFKHINDTLGHAAGDRLLQAVGGRLREAIREEDTVARLGGDEFAIILTRLEDPDDAALLADKLVKAVAQPTRIGKHVMTVSVSIGIGIYPDDARDAESLAKAADMALYGAKDKGRNAYEFYTEQMTLAATQAQVIDRSLRNAVRRNELALLYQPKVGLSDRRIAGMEALVRWNRPGHGMQSPAWFIPIAEETDLIDLIGDWVLDAAWTQLQRWRASGLPPVRVAVNLAARQVKRPGFMDDMRKMLAGGQALDGFGMDVEVAETVLQVEPAVVEALQELKSLGVGITVEDVGVGYCSLHVLKRLSVDMLKIDRSLIQGVLNDPDDRAVASAIIAMGHQLGMGVVAEGVETGDQLRFVVERGCDQGQGFLFFPPLGVGECGRVLDNK